MPLGRCVMRIADSVLLTCWPPAPCARMVSILRSSSLIVDIDVFDFGQHRDRRRRGMDAAGGFGVRHALHAMHAGFEFQLGEHAAAAHFGDDFLEAAFAAFADRQDLRLPALLGGVALVHAEQVAGEQRGLVAAGAGADFQDGVVIVHRVLRDQRQMDLLFELCRGALAAPAFRLQPSCAFRRRLRRRRPARRDRQSRRRPRDRP